ncbi:helix-turn-helix domain-containing protein [Streptomyces sp. NPDC000348]|uniref:helix-turn-helix domain-containing protein n=1 Tax=Streptomyces sp. NPDC000348 TaxID=3364538 RepID=UPI0036995112
MPTASSQSRGVLEGAFALLDALRRQGGEARLTQIAAACDLPKASTHRLLNQLLLLGAVERHNGRYRVGCQLYRLGQAWQPHPGLRLAARQPLHTLRAATGASVVVTVLHDGLALAVASVPGEVESVAPVRDGMGFPLDTAAGQVLTTSRPRRPADPLAAAVLEREQVMDGVCCAALPLHSPDGRLHAAITAMVPPQRRLQAVAEHAARAGAAITAYLTRAAASAADLPPILRH